MNNKKDLDNLRDCVKSCFVNGAKRGNEFTKMRHAIIIELKRLGYAASEIKDKVFEWNQRCEKPLGPSLIKRHLLGYVDWAVKIEGKIGCNALEDYCIGKDKCTFEMLRRKRNNENTCAAPFDFEAARRFLDNRYKGPDGYVMNMILTNLRRYQIEKTTGEIIYIGYRTLAGMIRDNNGHAIDLMTLSRRMEALITEGMVAKPVQGKRGTLSMRANGYKFLPWKAP